MLRRSGLLEQVADLVGSVGLPWNEQVTRGKMMALLMEWDASNPSTAVGHCDQMRSEIQSFQSSKGAACAISFSRHGRVESWCCQLMLQGLHLKRLMGCAGVHRQSLCQPNW